MASSQNDSELVQTHFQAGKAAFESGEYRKSVNYLEQAAALVSPNSMLGGEVQSWLMMAYEASGQGQAAIDLCRTLTKHPDINTRKEAKRVLYILEAPKLKARPEWFTQIPDLGNLAEGKGDRAGALPAASKKQSNTQPFMKLEPVDRSTVNTEDNRFVWVALIAVLIVLGSLLWLA